MVRVITIIAVITVLASGLLSASKKQYDVLAYKCVGCGDCTKVCPKDAVILKHGKAVIDPQVCIGCGQCFYICSFSAIRSYKER